MFNTQKTIKRLAAQVFGEIVAAGGITTEDVKMTKSTNFDNMRDYNIDNNKEWDDAKACLGFLLERINTLEQYLGIEFNEGVEGGDCEDCGGYVEEVEPSYTKVKKSKKGSKKA